MTWLRAVGRWFVTQKAIEAQEVMLAFGILLVSYGIAQWSKGAAFVAAGVIVLALHWPPSSSHEAPMPPDRKVR